MPCQPDETQFVDNLYIGSHSFTSDSDPDEIAHRKPTFFPNEEEEATAIGPSCSKNLSLADNIPSFWTLLKTINDIPPRAAHSCDLIGDSFVVIFGGWNGSDALNDLHILDLNDMKWHCVETENAPSKRNNHASSVLGYRLFIHGGHDGVRWLQDLHFIDLSNNLPGLANNSCETQVVTKPSWSQPNLGGKIPKPRACHTLARVRRKLYMFGGYDGTHCFNEMEVLDLEIMTWLNPSVKGKVPEGRNAHSLTPVNASLYLCGGHAGKRHMTDLFAYNTTTNTWIEINASGTLPPGLRGHTAALLGGSIILFGGYDGKVRNNDLYLLDVAREKWARHVDNSKVVVGRQRHSCVAIPSKRLLFFGGFNGSIWMNDLFTLDYDKLKEQPGISSTIRSLVNDMAQLVDNAVFADVTFRLGKDTRVINAHKCILAARNGYFRSMFTIPMKEKNTNTIEMPPWNYDPFRSLLEFLYSGAFKSGPGVEHLCEVLSIADHFGVEDLREICERDLSDMISTQNVCLLLREADRCQAKLLKERCLHYVFENADEVVGTKSFEELQLNPQLLMEVTRPIMRQSKYTIELSIISPNDDII